MIGTRRNSSEGLGPLYKKTKKSKEGKLEGS
jgi:hypothetical protein